MLKMLNARSTRSRYLIGAGIVGLIIVISAITAQLYVAKTSTQSAENIQTRNAAIQHSYKIRVSLAKAEDVLTDHLLSPSPDYIDLWIKHLNESILHTQQFLQSKWSQDTGQVEIIQNLKNDLETYNQHAVTLMKLRMIPAQQYPGFDHAQNYLLPKSQEIFSLAESALQDILEEDESNLTETYTTFVQLRHLWARMIITFRMYLGNRIGSLNEAGILEQEKAIEIYYQNIIEGLEKLRLKDQKGLLSITASIASKDILDTARNWYQNFLVVKKIHHDNKWRTDILQINKYLRPLDERITNALKHLELNIENSATEDVSTLSGMASTIINSMWLFTIIGLALISAGFLYFEFTIMRPVAMVAKALKAEARGEQHHELPEIHTEEAENLIAAFSDMRNQVYNRQKALEYQAMHDALTGLPNRTLLHDRLEQGINAANRKNTTLALLIMDLDHFKEINDTLGHHIGDEILIQLGTRIVNLLRDSDTVARLGGDEFAILLPTSDKGAAVFIAQKIQKKISEVFIVQEHKLHIGASIGAVISPDHGDNADILMQHADVAMYMAKRDKADIFVYDPDLDTHTVGRLSLVTDLRDAIANDTLELYYQPKLRLASGKAYGAEALLRWNHPVRGFIPPDEIIAAAEFSGVIKSLTKWVINKALKQNGLWNNSGIELSISINLSVHDLQDKGLIKHVDQKISEYGINPRNIVFEITESAMMSDPDCALNTLSELDDMDIWLSIDDYGTGFSSLAYIKRLPVDELKIDKSFVLNMHSDENDAVIVRSTIDLAHNLGLKVVAEGVEDLDTWDLLALLGCDSAQGFYMSKPLPPSEFEKWYEENMKG